MHLEVANLSLARALSLSRSRALSSSFQLLPSSFGKLHAVRANSPNLQAGAWGCSSLFIFKKWFGAPRDSVALSPLVNNHQIETAPPTWRLGRKPLRERACGSAKVAASATTRDSGPGSVLRQSPCCCESSFSTVYEITCCKLPPRRSLFRLLPSYCRARTRMQSSDCRFLTIDTTHSPFLGRSLKSNQ